MLHLLQQRTDIEIVALVTTVSNDAVSMHRTPVALLEEQSTAAGLPLWLVEIPDPCPNRDYEQAMHALIERARAENIDAMAFGDLFLEDVRDYRMSRLEGTGIAPMFPLWGIPTDELSARMIAGGLRASVVCVDTDRLDAAFLGREFDELFLGDLPEGVDRCGERGEFHTFCHGGPMYSGSIEFEAGRRMQGERFIHLDLNSSTATVPSGATHEDGRVRC